MKCDTTLFLIRKHHLQNINNILAIDTEGKKELIGMYISESEDANYWCIVLTGLKSREVKIF